MRHTLYKSVSGRLASRNVQTRKSWNKSRKISVLGTWGLRFRDHGSSHHRSVTIGANLSRGTPCKSSPMTLFRFHWKRVRTLSNRVGTAALERTPDTGCTRQEDARHNTGPKMTLASFARCRRRSVHHRGGHGAGVGSVDLHAALGAALGRTPCTLQVPYKKTGSIFYPLQKRGFFYKRTIEWRNGYPGYHLYFSRSSQSAGVAALGWL